MKIISAELTHTEVDIAKFPIEGRFEIVLIGKSNVGKSSFINSMLNRRSLARTSGEPGKTRTANFYLVNNDFYFVDMPGYGYAKTSKTKRVEFDKMIRDYLKKRKTDFVVFFLLDNRHRPTNNDKEMFEFLRDAGISPVLILTKRDKLKNSERAGIIRNIMEDLELTEDDAVFDFSAVNGYGKEDIWSFIGEIMNGGEGEEE